MKAGNLAGNSSGRAIRGFRAPKCGASGLLRAAVPQAGLVIRHRAVGGAGLGFNIYEYS